MIPIKKMNAKTIAQSFVADRTLRSFVPTLVSYVAFSAIFLSLRGYYGKTCTTRPLPDVDGRKVHDMNAGLVQRCPVHVREFVRYTDHPCFE